MFIPKLHIHLADFPCPRYSARLEAIDLGDLLRFRYDFRTPPSFYSAHPFSWQKYHHRNGIKSLPFVLSRNEKGKMTEIGKDGAQRGKS